jgi:hypothetical protein
LLQPPNLQIIGRYDQKVVVPERSSDAIFNNMRAFEVPKDIPNGVNFLFGFALITVMFDWHECDAGDRRNSVQAFSIEAKLTAFRNRLRLQPPVVDGVGDKLAK